MLHQLLALPLLAAWLLPVQEAPVARAVAAPAADLISGRLRLPDPSAHPFESRATWIDLADGAEGREGELVFDAARPVSLALVSPQAGGLTLHLRAPGEGWTVAGERADVVRTTQVLDEPLRGWIVDRYDVPAGEAGTLAAALSGSSAGWPAFLVVRDDEPAVLEVFLDSWSRVAGEPLGLVARVASGEFAQVAIHARLEDGRGVRSVQLADDGVAGDRVAGDGLFTVLLPESLGGNVLARVDASTLTAAGTPLRRTTFASFTLHERALMLSGAARVRALDAGHAALDLEAWNLGPARRMLVAAELWGRDAAGHAQPVCWLAHMVEPRARGARSDLTLELDLRWPGYAGLVAPFELRSVRVQDPDSFGVLDTRDAIALGELPLARGTPVPAFLPAMLGLSATASGPRPAAAHQVPPKALLLSHGYCSGGNVWPAADFTQPKLVFLDPNQNRTHDQFAQLLAAAGSSVDSFGTVAHSQGGAAALHLYTYYASPLDHAVGARRMQSVATPYQGTPLASLGGFACGVNNDMTPAGSATWLAGIPTWARAEVYYWTTSNSGSACNALTSLFLTDPEDGTVEQFRGQLPGANNMGHVIGWCHTTGMSNPANYTDHARNAQMNAQAAR